MRVEKDYQEFLKLLNKHKVKYCIVGAYAVAFYAKPRYTKDMDILVEAEPSNAKKILKALNEFGFGSLPISEEDFSTPGNIIQLGYEPLRIDLLTSLPGIDFPDAWDNRVSGIYGSQEVYFISLDDLIRTKKQSNRNSDKVDLELLEKAKR
ncbi:MAG: nucleotidyltransferase [Acidobacteriota bacterium]